MIRTGVLYVAAIYFFICFAAASMAGADMQEIDGRMLVVASGIQTCEQWQSAMIIRTWFL